MTGRREPQNPQVQRQLVAVTQVLTRWGVTQPQQAQLLGLTRRGLRRVQRGTPPLTLPPEQHARVRLMAEILAALITLYAPHTVGGWLERPNGRPPFGGQRPLAVLLTCGLPALLATHDLLYGDLSGQFSATTEARRRAAHLSQPPIDLDE